MQDGSPVRIPVLFICGYAPDSAKAVEMIAADDLLQKPFTPKQPLRRVQEKLGTASGH